MAPGLLTAGIQDICNRCRGLLEFVDDRESHPRQIRTLVRQRCQPRRYLRLVDKLIRWLLPFSHSWISRDTALEVASRAAQERGLPWERPFGAYRHYGDWSVRSTVNSRGGNVMVIIDGASGAVKWISGPTPR